MRYEFSGACILLYPCGKLAHIHLLEMLKERKYAETADRRVCNNETGMVLGVRHILLPPIRIRIERMNVMCVMCMYLVHCIHFIRCCSSSSFSGRVFSFCLQECTAHHSPLSVYQFIRAVHFWAYTRHTHAHSTWWFFSLLADGSAFGSALLLPLLHADDAILSHCGCP